MALPFFRQQGDEAIFERRRAGRGLEFIRRAGREHATAIHGDEPVEALRFFHIGCRDENAQARALRAHAGDQIPKLAPRERIDAGRRLVENEQIRIMDERAAETELLPHAAGELFRRPVGKGRKAGAFEQKLHPRLPLGTRAGRRDGRRIRYFPRRSDRHRDCGPSPAAYRRSSDRSWCDGTPRAISPSRTLDPALLDAAGAGDEAQQRGFADAVGADEADHCAGRNREIDRIERPRLAISERNAGERGDRRLTLVHGMPSLRNCFGHSALESRRT